MYAALIYSEAKYKLFKITGELCNQKMAPEEFESSLLMQIAETD